MSTAMSTKRSFISERGVSKPAAPRSEAQIALYAFVAGILLLLAGTQVNVDILMIAGFFFAVCGALALNALFWAGYYKEHGGPEGSSYSQFYE